MAIGPNAQHWLGIRFILADDLDLTAEVSGPFIVVRVPRGTFRATYKRSPGSHQLILVSEWFSNGRISPLTLAHFRNRAWRLANNKAAELGWFRAM
jgi:hypothetical protein